MTPGWTGASLAALLVASMLAVPEAHAVFEGVLKPGMPTTITLAAQGNNATATVLTAKRSRLSVLGILTALPFNMTQLAKTLPNVDRVIISVNLPPQGSATLHIVQGTIDSQFQVSDQDRDFIYNVAP